MSVFTPAQVARYRSIVTDADPRLFLKTGTTEEEPNDGIEFAEGEEDVNVDDI
jgi:hypothetical protein